MRRRLSIIVLTLLVGGFAWAGIKSSHVQQFPPADFARDFTFHLIEGANTASLVAAIKFYTAEDWYLDAVAVTTRLTSGTITQYTIPLYANGNLLPFKAAIDAYGGALATAGTPQWANISKLDPLYIKSGTALQASLLLAGSDTPTVTDTSVEFIYHTKAGLEQ